MENGYFTDRWYTEVLETREGAFTSEWVHI